MNFKMNCPRQNLQHRFRRLLLGAASGLLGVAIPLAVCARYVPDNSIAPNGVVDIRIRGDALVTPAAVYASVSGNEFVTIARRDTLLAVCAFSTTGIAQSGFGIDGCYRETLGPTDFPYQLLVGKRGYWVFIADSNNARRFVLLRLTSAGRADTSYGSADAAAST